MIKQKEKEREKKGRRIKSFSKLLKQIFSGYRNLIFQSREVQEIAELRKDIIQSKCKCTEYYLDLKFKIFKKEYRIKMFAYCKHCGCIIEAKVRCIECSCPKNLWK